MKIYKNIRIKIKNNSMAKKSKRESKINKKIINNKNQ